MVSVLGFLLIMAPLIEELAWHSYGTDCLRARFNLFNASTIFAFFWGIWHIPLGTINGYYQSELVEAGWIHSVAGYFNESLETLGQNLAFDAAPTPP